MSAEPELLFDVEHVSKRFQLPRTRLFGPRQTLTAVNDVSFVLLPRRRSASSASQAPARPRS